MSDEVERPSSEADLLPRDLEGAALVAHLRHKVEEADKQQFAPLWAALKTMRDEIDKTVNDEWFPGDDKILPRLAEERRTVDLMRAAYRRLLLVFQKYLEKEASRTPPETRPDPVVEESVVPIRDLLDDVIAALVSTAADAKDLHDALVERTTALPPELRPSGGCVACGLPPYKVVEEKPWCVRCLPEKVVETAEDTPTPADAAVAEETDDGETARFTLPPPWTKELGRQLEDVRTLKAFTQKALGQLVGVSYNSIANWESARFPPNAQMQAKLVLALGGPNDPAWKDPRFATLGAHLMREPPPLLEVLT